MAFSIADLGIQYLQAIIESSDDAIITKDRDAIIRSWNPGAERLYGWKAAEVVGRPISILIPPQRAGEERRILDEILAGRRVDHYETERVRKDGRRVWVSLTISPVADEREIVAASVIARDVTERRELDRERARLLAESEEARAVAERRGAQLAFLAKASEVLSESLDEVGALERLVQLLHDGVVERSAAHLVEEGEIRLVARSSAEPRAATEAPLLVSSVIQADDLEAHPEIPEQAVWPGSKAQRAVSALVVPISAHGRALGAITLVDVAGREFKADEVRLVEEVGRRAGLAVENARAYQVEHTAAMTLQRTLLPRELPPVSSVESAARYLPAGSSVNVGGDWYDLIAIPGGGIIGAIGDVAGRALPAATAMGQLRNAVRAYALEGHRPAELLERVNRFSQGLDHPEMATITLVAITPAADAVEVVCAGHPPPLLRRPDGTVGPLEARASLPVGASPHASYVATRHELEPGMTLVLFTDGLVERRGEALESGVARLARAVAAGPDDLEALADTLMESVAEEAQRADDVALLLLRTATVDTSTFSFQQIADPDSLAMLRRALRQWLGKAVGDPQAVHDVIAACSEAASNVVEHAYPRGSGPLEVGGRRGEGGLLELEVRDFGKWRPERDTGGGRGLRLIRAMMDDVEVEAGTAGTRILMRRRLAEEDDRRG